MATGFGTATLNFGAWPGSNTASVAVTGQASIAATSQVEAFLMARVLGTKSANDHVYLKMLADFVCGIPTAGVGFTIFAISPYKLMGSFTLDYTWAD